ncbi:tyrosine-type recombinase/integrase [Thermodesulfobacteriota bacterium]
MEKSFSKKWVKNRNYACSTNSLNSWRTLPRSIEPEDVKRLLRKRFNPRDKCMILMLLRTGMRVCELLALKLQDLNLKERIVTIHVGAKNGRGRIVCISDDAYKELRKWIKVRDPKRKYLFYSRCKENMCYETARSSFINCLRKARLKRKGYTLHCLRHTFASELLSAGMPLESLQVLMGHSNIEVTRRYARLTDKALEKDYFRAMQIIERGEIHGSYRNDNQI